MSSLIASTNFDITDSIVSEKTSIVSPSSQTKAWGTKFAVKQVKDNPGPLFEQTW